MTIQREPETGVPPMPIETEHDPEPTLELTEPETHILDLYLQAARSGFQYAVSLTRGDHHKQEYFGGKMDAAIDRTIEACSRFDQGDRILDALYARHESETEQDKATPAELAVKETRC